MYFTCRVCGNDTFKVSFSLILKCTKCGATFSLRREIDVPEPRKPLKPEDDVRPFEF